MDSVFFIGNLPILFNEIINIVMIQEKYNGKY